MDAKQIADRIVNKSGSYQEVMSYTEGTISSLINRSEAAEARAAELKDERDEWQSAYLVLLDSRAEYINKLSAEEAAHRDDVAALRKELEQAQARISRLVISLRSGQEA